VSAGVEITGDSLKIPRGTYSVKNRNDSTLIRNSFSFLPWKKEKAVDHHIRIEIPSGQKKIFFGSNIWNDKKGKIVLRNVKVDVYVAE